MSLSIVDLKLLLSAKIVLLIQINDKFLLKNIVLQNNFLIKIFRGWFFEK